MENLIRIQEKDICKNARALLLDGEQVVGAYKTVRDQVIFTTHRIIMVDMQGVTGTRQQIFVLPYRKVLHFGIQTAGFGDPIQALPMATRQSSASSVRRNCSPWPMPSAGAFYKGNSKGLPHFVRQALLLDI